MDFNFADLKKEAAATADDIFGQATDAVKQASAKVAHELGEASPGRQDDNAHTEQYFANEQKDIDFEHVDPQTFVQRMSATAKEAQEQLDAKFSNFAQQPNDYDDFLTNASKELNSFGQQAQQSVKHNITGLTNDFMNMERGFHGGMGDAPARDLATKQPEPMAPVASTGAAATSHVDDLLGDFEHGDSKSFQPTAPAVPVHHQNIIDDDFAPAAAALTKNVVASSKDSDTESPSLSYNPSPAKKPVADALKEQDNEKFISSEDLLSDFKDERTGGNQSDYHSASAGTATTGAAAEATVRHPTTSNIPTTDLDDDEDFMSNYSPAKSTTAATIATAAATAPPPPVPAHSHAETVKEEVLKQPTPAPTPTPTPAPQPTSTAAAKAAAEPNVATAAAKKEASAQHPKIVSVEEIFYKYGLDAWFKPERLHPRVESLIYWRDVKKSGIVFGAGLIILLAISCFSVISVFAYVSLLSLAGTIAFRIYKSVMQAVQKTSDGHPFKEFLEYDVTLSQEKIQNVAGVAVAHINGFTAELRRLFLVEDLVDSIKFGVILWVMTYIGAWFNGMTLVILAFVSLFTLPKVYENNKQSIDTYLDLVRSKLTEITDKIKVAIPIGKKPAVSESDKDK